jgi:cytochrome c oxidase subunit 3
MTQSDLALREPWESLPRQREAATFGIWIFLASELLFFGGLFLGYTVCRVLYPHAFAEAGRETDIWYGTVNTAVLLTSSLTMAVAAGAGEAGLRRTALWCFGATIALGAAFLIFKGFEYNEDLIERLWPGPGFKLQEEPAAQLFFAFYWVMTGLHAVHLTIGMCLIGRLWFLTYRRRLPLEKSPQVEVTALYWHLIDVIWIFLYPILYLGGRA